VQLVHQPTPNVEDLDLQLLLAPHRAGYVQPNGGRRIEWIRVLFQQEFGQGYRIRHLDEAIRPVDSIAANVTTEGPPRRGVRIITERHVPDMNQQIPAAVDDVHIAVKIQIAHDR